jgi:hypothetical protein
MLSLIAMRFVSPLLVGMMTVIRGLRARERREGFGERLLRHERPLTLS